MIFKDGWLTDVWNSLTPECAGVGHQRQRLLMHMNVMYMWTAGGSVTFTKPKYIRKKKPLQKHFYGCQETLWLLIIFKTSYLKITT